MAHAAEFFTLAEINRIKVIQDVVDRRLTTQIGKGVNRAGITRQLKITSAGRHFTGESLYLLTSYKRIVGPV